MKYFSEEKLNDINALEIRTSTEHKEVLAIRRFFYHPLYIKPQYYYDLAILELGK